MKSTIFDIENWREIGATLARNKTRTFLTAFGIFWGTAMLAMLLGGASGLEGMLKRNFKGFATNMGGIMSNRTSMSYKGYNKGLSWDLTEMDIATIRRTVPHISASSTVTYSTIVNVAYGSKSTSTSANGVESDYSKIQIPTMYHGRFINASDVKNNRKVTVMGKNIANEIFGNTSPIGKYVSVSGIYFLVIGVAGQMSEATINNRLDDSMIMPSTTMRQAFNMGTDVGFFIFTADDGHRPSELLPGMKRVIRANHPIHPNDDNAIYFIDVSEQFEMVDNLFLGISILALFVGIGTLLAGIIGVGNIMWIIVKERTQEIGVRRAIGAKPRDIIVQILSEGVVMTAIAGTAGLTFATVVLYIANIITTDPILGSAGFEITFNHAISIMTIFLLLGTAAGMIPAIKAMRIKPIEALNDK